MSKWFQTFVFIFFINPSFANDCFNEHKRDGLNQYRLEKFDEAKKLFKAAEGCDDNSERQRLDAQHWYEKADSAYDHALQVAKEKAERGMIIAQATSHALQAENELEIGNTEGALELASQAFLALEEQDTLIESVALTFGNAVYANTSQEIPKSSSSKYQLHWLPEASEILEVGLKHLARFEYKENSFFPVFSKQTDTILHVAVSPDGSQYLSTYRNGKVGLWESNSSEFIEINAHESAVIEGVFSNDRSEFMTTSRNHEVKLWDYRGNFTRSFNGHEAPVVDVEFSPNSMTVITRSSDGTAIIWMNDGQMVREIGEEVFIYEVKFSLDGKYIASAHLDGKIRIWDLKGVLLHTIEAHQKAALKIEFLEDGTLFSMGVDRMVKHWAINGQLLNEYMFDGIVSEIDFTADENSFIVGMLDGVVELRQINGPYRMKISSNSSRVKTLAFSPDNTKLLVLWEDGSEIICSHPESVSQTLR